MKPIPSPLAWVGSSQEECNIKTIVIWESESKIFNPKKFLEKHGILF